MKIQQIGKIKSGQDGAIFGHELFRFDAKGRGRVYDLRELCAERELEPFATFTLDRVPGLVPHSNAVFFGNAYYAEGDEFPLLYSNIYNNYKAAEDPMMGVLLAYRLQRTEEGFVTTLVQNVRVDFVEDASLWKASEEGHGMRPYGNFVMDNEKGELYAFVMRNEEKGTRYFCFDAPTPRDGELDADGVRHVVLTPSDIKRSFDMPYYRYIQGATLYRGCIYSTEGFRNDSINRPAIRVVELERQCETYYDLTECGMTDEAEMIDFYQGDCYYSDADGRVYFVRF